MEIVIEPNQINSKNTSTQKSIMEMIFITLIMISIIMVNCTFSVISNYVSNIFDTRKDILEVASSSQTLFLDDPVILRYEQNVVAKSKINTRPIVEGISKKHNNMINIRESTKIVDTVINQIMSEYHGDIPVSLVLALIEKESTFNTKASSYDGSSFGSMQVNYKVWKSFCNLSHPNDLKNTQTGIRCGLKVLSFYLDKNNGNIDKALMAYRGSTNRHTNLAYVRDIRSKMKIYRKLVRSM